MLFERFDGEIIDVEEEYVEFFSNNPEYRVVRDATNEEEGELDF